MSAIEAALQELLRKQDVINIWDFIPRTEHEAIQFGQSTLALDEYINEGIYWSIKKRGNVAVYFPGGLYLVDDVIHAGYGINSKESVILYGGNYCYREPSDFNGPMIRSTFSDRPIISIHGAMGTAIKGFGLSGPITSYYDDNQLAQLDGALIDDTDKENWKDPGFSLTQDDRYRPFTAIAIDPFAGDEPAEAYPHPKYPEGLGLFSHYGKVVSSNVLLEDLYIERVGTGIVIQPSIAPGNGDFTSIVRTSIEKAINGISVTNTQSRNVHIDRLIGNTVHTMLTNRAHGRQEGKFGGVIQDMSVSGVMNLMDFGGVYPQPITFINPYAEVLYRLGDVDFTGTADLGYKFIGGQFSFTAQGESRGYPAFVLGGNNSNFGAMMFENTTFDHFGSVLNLASSGAAFENVQFQGSDKTTIEDQQAHNLLSGGLVLPKLEKGYRSSIQGRAYDFSTGNLRPGVNTTAYVDWGDRDSCIPLAAERVKGSAMGRDEILPPALVNVLAKSALNSVSLVEDTLTLVFNTRDEWQFHYQGPLEGDVLLCDQSGSAFFVQSRSGMTVTATLQNNKKKVSGVWETIESFSETDGNFYIGNSRIFTPPYYLRGNLENGSSEIKEIGTDENWAGFVEDSVKVDDWLYVDSRRDNHVSVTGAKITAVDGTTRIITLDNPGWVRTEERKRLEYFIKGT